MPFLPNLEHLYFVNCVKVTDRGLVALLSQNVIGLRGLGLEGVSPNFVCSHLYSARVVHELASGHERI